MNAVKRLQVAEDLDFHSLSHNKTKLALRKILGDPKYTTNAKKLSIVINDQKEKPLERAIWWIEWVLRYPQINTLKSPVNTLGYIVGNSLDVISFATVFFILQIFVLYKFLYLVFRLVFAQRQFKQITCCNIVEKCKKLQ